MVRDMRYDGFFLRICKTVYSDPRARHSNGAHGMNPTPCHSYRRTADIFLAVVVARPGLVCPYMRGGQDIDRAFHHALDCQEGPFDSPLGRDQCDDHRGTGLLVNVNLAVSPCRLLLEPDWKRTLLVFRLHHYHGLCLQCRGCCLRLHCGNFARLCHLEPADEPSDQVGRGRNPEYGLCVCGVIIPFIMKLLLTVWTQRQRCGGYPHSFPSSLQRSRLST